MAKKYLKNSEGTVRAITSDNLGLEKPLVNENYDIEVHNRNMDKIDGAVTTNKSDIATNKSDIANLKTKTDVANTSLSSLQTKGNNGQNHKITQDNGLSFELTSANLNTITKAGNYVGNNWVNGPSTNYAIVEVTQGTSGIVKQLFTATTSTNQYMRIYRSSTWSEWREL